ncbi:MAG: DUF3575 domain-containing protein [Tannerellaceae bacterium]|jgi:hypothetical protein|nr:DUF3575 domain-containing protein [Tannerellaceae bacterium]
MKQIHVLIILMALIALPNVKAQTVAVKNNLLYDLTTTINLGLEIAMSPQWTLELPVNYNPWDLGENRKLKHWLIQPEVRYWFCQKFNGHFMGLHGHIGGYNIGGIEQIGMEEFRYEGNLYGGGISYGYHWILSTHWSIEATIGAGYAYMEYAKYKCEKCAEKLSDDVRPYLGPTKVGVSLIYIIK